LKPTQAKLPRDQPSSRKKSFCFPVKRAPRASAARLLLVKISRAIPPVSAVTPAHVSSAHSAAAAADEIEAEVAVQTAAAVVPIAAAQTVVQTAGAQAARDSNAVPAVPAVPAMTVVTVIPVRRAVRSSSAKC
jgi:hypothetical protein